MSERSMRQLLQLIAQRIGVSYDDIVTWLRSQNSVSEIEERILRSGYGAALVGTTDERPRRSARRRAKRRQLPLHEVHRIQGRRVILLAPGSRDWSYDFTARALVKHLGDRFDFRVAYTPSDVIDQAPAADLIVDFWWRGGLERRFGRRVLKQVSSHRWQQRQYGRLTPRLLTERHLSRAGSVVVPSQRLHALLSPYVDCLIAPKGFEPSMFGDEQRRTGDLVVGWAGNARYPDKRVSLLREAWPEIRVTERIAYADMPGWYNAIDVITCASDAEGDPRPLIEGMACGCFPVTVDVGIVPELVRHGENGLIVERTPEAFRAALRWCRENLDFVRAAGRRNAEQMLASRTWAHCMPAWSAAIERILACPA